MHLAQLIDGLSEKPIGGPPDLEISGVTADSRQVKPGSLFVAMRGTQFDGHVFLSDAVEMGAVVAVGEIADPGIDIPYLQVANSQLAMAEIAAAYHGYPGRKLVMIGITGTDGKTTTCNLLYSILREAGIRAGMITTVNAIIGDQILDTGFHVTTPEPMTVQGYLQRMADAGLTHCILETTSHGLAQHRVTACDFDLGVLTNITHEHLDYHGSYSEYREAKARLFKQLLSGNKKDFGPEKCAVLNRDDSSYDYLESVTDAKILSYGIRESAQVRAQDVESTIEGLSLTIVDGDQSYPVHSPLVGEYNLSNLLAAWTAGVKGLGLSPQTALRGFAALQGVPGRMEVIDLGQDFTAIVDFAHTPNALQFALETAKSLTQGKLIAVFGSAGLRDRQKRRMMAAVSNRIADITILTAEDPRTEPLQEILAEMAAGAEEAGGRENETFYRIPDRGEALNLALQLAGKGDLVISCGKGHEQSMCFGEIEYPWDDRTAMRAALAARLGQPGPAMPSLPTSNTV